MIPALLPVAAGAVQALTSAAPAASTASASADFSSALADAAGGALKTIRAAETTSTAGMQGKATVQQVVDNMMSAERTLQATLAIRDKAVAAYQQISQMQI